MYKQLPTPPKHPPPKSLSEAREEQRKHALNVAKATATAAEAAVVAAQAAVEVVRLTCVSNPSLRQQEKEIQNMAAIKIQTAFRGYIARKALRALKGVIKLQAIARGRAVRRRVEHLASNNHSQVLQPIRLPTTIDAAQINQSSKLECKSQRRWTDTLCSKEEVESIYRKRQDAVTRRERMKQYSFSHRERQYSQMIEETMPLRNNERHASCPRRQWAEDNTYNKGNLENATLNFHSSSRLSDLSANLRINPRNLAKQNEFGEEVSSPYSHPRRSFCHLRLKPGGDDCQLSSSSLMYPTYMAATESAKAKMRSMSTPRQRLGHLDTCFEQGYWSSYNGDSVSTTTIGKSNLSQPKSLSMEVFRRA